MVDYHAVDAQAALLALDSSEHGLAEGQVESLRAKYGPNRLPESAPEPAWKRFLAQFHNVLIYVLLAAAVVSGLLQHYVDAGVIVGVVVVNSLVGFLQDITERKSAELALAESEERFELAMLGANDGVFDWNLESYLEDSIKLASFEKY